MQSIWSDHHETKTTFIINKKGLNASGKLRFLGKKLYEFRLNVVGSSISTISPDHGVFCLFVLFCLFLLLFCFVFYDFFVSFSLTWDPMGAKVSRRYSYSFHLIWDKLYEVINLSAICQEKVKNFMALWFF